MLDKVRHMYYHPSPDHTTGGCVTTLKEGQVTREHCPTCGAFEGHVTAHCPKPMSRAEALAEATRRWGKDLRPGTRDRLYLKARRPPVVLPEWAFEVGYIANHKCHIIGHGPSYEAAFLDANRRAK